MSVRHHHTKSWLFAPGVPGVLLTSVPLTQAEGEGQEWEAGSKRTIKIPQELCGVLLSPPPPQKKTHTEHSWPLYWARGSRLEFSVSQGQALLPPPHPTMLLGIPDAPLEAGTAVGTHREQSPG